VALNVKPSEITVREAVGGGPREKLSDRQVTAKAKRKKDEDDQRAATRENAKAARRKRQLETDAIELPKALRKVNEYMGILEELIAGVDVEQQDEVDGDIFLVNTKYIERQEALAQQKSVRKQVDVQESSMKAWIDMLKNATEDAAGSCDNEVLENINATHKHEAREGIEKVLKEISPFAKDAYGKIPVDLPKLKIRLGTTEAAVSRLKGSMKGVVDERTAANRKVQEDQVRAIKDRLDQFEHDFDLFGSRSDLPAVSALSEAQLKEQFEEEIQHLNNKICVAEERHAKLKSEAGVLLKTEQATRKTLVEYDQMEDKMESQIVKFRRQPCRALKATEPSDNALVKTESSTVDGSSDGVIVADDKEEIEIDLSESDDEKESNVSSEAGNDFDMDAMRRELDEVTDSRKVDAIFASMKNKLALCIPKVPIRVGLLASLANLKEENQKLKTEAQEQSEKEQAKAQAERAREQAKRARERVHFQIRKSNDSVDELKKSKKELEQRISAEIQMARSATADHHQALETLEEVKAKRQQRVQKRATRAKRINAATMSSPRKSQGETEGALTEPHQNTVVCADTSSEDDVPEGQQPPVVSPFSLVQPSSTVSLHGHNDSDSDADQVVEEQAGQSVNTAREPLLGDPISWAIDEGWQHSMNETIPGNPQEVSAEQRSAVSGPIVPRNVSPTVSKIEDGRDKAGEELAEAEVQQAAALAAAAEAAFAMETAARLAKEAADQAEAERLEKKAEEARQRFRENEQASKKDYDNHKAEVNKTRKKAKDERPNAPKIQLEKSFPWDNSPGLAGPPIYNRARMECNADLETEKAEEAAKEEAAQRRREQVKVAVVQAAKKTAKAAATHAKRYEDEPQSISFAPTLPMWSVDEMATVSTPTEYIESAISGGFTVNDYHETAVMATLNEEVETTKMLAMQASSQACAIANQVEDLKQQLEWTRENVEFGAWTRENVAVPAQALNTTRGVWQFHAGSVERREDDRHSMNSRAFTYDAQQEQDHHLQNMYHQRLMLDVQDAEGRMLELRQRVREHQALFQIGLESNDANPQSVVEANLVRHVALLDAQHEFTKAQAEMNTAFETMQAPGARKSYAKHLSHHYERLFSELTIEGNPWTTRVRPPPERDGVKNEKHAEEAKQLKDAKANTSDMDDMNTVASEYMRQTNATEPKRGSSRRKADEESRNPFMRAKTVPKKIPPHSQLTRPSHAATVDMSRVDSTVAVNTAAKRTFGDTVSSLSGQNDFYSIHGFGNTAGSLPSASELLEMGKVPLFDDSDDKGNRSVVIHNAFKGVGREGNQHASQAVWPRTMSTANARAPVSPPSPPKTARPYRRPQRNLGTAPARGMKTSNRLPSVSVPRFAMTQRLFNDLTPLGTPVGSKNLRTPIMSPNPPVHPRGAREMRGAGATVHAPPKPATRRAQREGAAAAARAHAYCSPHPQDHRPIIDPPSALTQAVALNLLQNRSPTIGEVSKRVSSSVVLSTGW